MTYRFDASGMPVELSAEEMASLDNDGAIYVLDRGTQVDGSPYWAYIAVKPSRYKEFIRLCNQRASLRFSDYGTVLAFGNEKDVPEAIRQSMQAQYNLDSQYLLKLKKEVAQAQAGFLKQKEEQRIAGIVSMLQQKQS